MVLYEFVTGMPPFNADSPEVRYRELMWLHVSDWGVHASAAQATLQFAQQEPD